MVPVDLETRVKMVGYDHIGSYEAGIPAYIVRAKIEAEEKQKIPSVPQFVLRLIDLGFNNETALVTALGLEKDFVRDALEFLNRNQLVLYRADSALASALVFAVTGDGKKAIQDALSASFVTYVLDIGNSLTKHRLIQGVDERAEEPSPREEELHGR